MIRIDLIKIDAKEYTDIKDYIRNKYFEINDFNDFRILKKSIDSRNKNDIKFVYSVCLSLNEKKENQLIKKYKNIDKYCVKEYTVSKSNNCDKQVVVIGSGPAGIFCAYDLCLAGYKPIIIERGKCVDDRIEDVQLFFDKNELNVNSNIQFGEGGAGTFSDGKLNTQIKDKEGRIDFVLKTFNEFGADESILYDSKPHIGTDILREVIKNMRYKIESMGGRYLFEHQFVSFTENNNVLTQIEIKDLKTGKSNHISCDYLCLALGHSARDTFSYLKDKLNIVKKPFAMGFRVIHTQEFIDKAQYGENYKDLYEILPVSPYKLTYTTKENRGVYSFCMCPGGFVVNASSESKKLCVNGMSYFKRDSGYANSAIIVQINPDDFSDDNVLSGMEFQREIEEKAFLLGKGNIPVSAYSDFAHKNYNDCQIEPEKAILGSFEFANLREIFPQFINDSIIEAFSQFNNTIKGFEEFNPLMAGVESRTSSPIRIVRNAKLESDIKGIFPCGEGAGYAGGIVSAAVDGMKVAEQIINYGE